MSDNPQPSSESPRKRGLGRGLSALLPGAESIAGERASEVALTLLMPNPFQPRQTTDAEELAGLADSIKKHGVLQPIIVRPVRGGYEVVAGERRWRAAEAAGLKAIPAVVRELTNREALELALVENLQRSDLNPVERARAYQRLIEEFRLTQEQVAERVAKSQPSVANALRLLHLPPQVLTSLEAGRISEGHARALLSIGDQKRMLKVLERIERRGLSVRETEALSKASISREILLTKRPQDPQLRAVEQDLSRRYGTKVSVAGSRNRGFLAFAFYSEEDLQRLLDLLLD